MPRLGGFLCRNDLRGTSECGCAGATSVAEATAATPPSASCCLCCTPPACGRSVSARGAVGLAGVTEGSKTAAAAAVSGDAAPGQRVEGIVNGSSLSVGRDGLEAWRLRAPASIGAAAAASAPAVPERRRNDLRGGGGGDAASPSAGANELAGCCGAEYGRGTAASASVRVWGAGGRGAAGLGDGVVSAWLVALRSRSLDWGK